MPKQKQMNATEFTIASLQKSMQSSKTSTADSCA